MAGLSIGTARSASQNITSGRNTGMQGSRISPQKTSNVVATFNPQSRNFNPQGNNVNPMNVRSTATGGGGGGDNTQGFTVAAADPYSQWGGRAAYDRLTSGFDNQKSSIFDSSLDAARNYGLENRNNILDLIDSLRTGQQAVDNRAINNELSRQRGVADTYSAVGRGIQSGGVTLANKNASDSSAAGAIARAYGSIGQRQLSDIGNQYELENQDVGLMQTDLDRQRASGVRRLETSQEQAVNSIVSDANNKLAALDAAMANASLPDRIALDSEKNRIRSQVLAELGKYDNRLGDVNKIKAMDRNARIAEATRRGQLGQAPEAQFDYNTEIPGALEGTGPFASDLPIFTYRNRDDL